MGHDEERLVFGSKLLLFLASLGLFTWLGALGSVFGTSATTTVDSKAVETATNNMITDTREILHTASTHKHNGVLLKVVTLATDIGDHFLAVGEANLGNLAKRRVWLLGGSGHHLHADTATLGTIHERW